MGFNLEDFMNNESLKHFQRDVQTGREVVMLPADKLIPDADNFYSEDSGRIRKLAASIEMLSSNGRLGVQQELIVKPVDGTDTYQIIAGETRWRAVKLLLDEGRADSDLIPCRIERNDDAVRQELILILTNSTQRERSDAEKMQEIKRLRELLSEYKKHHPIGGTVQQAIADILGISKTKVGTLENINRNLSEGLKERYQQGDINTAVANKLAGQPEEVQKRINEHLKIQKGALTVADIEKVAGTDNTTSTSCAASKKEVISILNGEIAKELEIIETCGKQEEIRHSVILRALRSYQRIVNRRWQEECDKIANTEQESIKE